MNKLNEARDLLANNFCRMALEEDGKYCSAGAVGKVLDLYLHRINDEAGNEIYSPYKALNNTTEIRVLAETIAEQYPAYQEILDNRDLESNNSYVEIVYLFNDTANQDLEGILDMFDKAATKLEEQA
jgi:hypothetical protein